MNPTRRRALAVLGGAVVPALLATIARAQDVSPPTPTLQPPDLAPAPASPPTPSAPAAPAAPVIPPAPPRPVVAGPAATGTGATGTGAIDRTKRYIVFFDGTIDVNSMKSLRRQLSILVEAGVSEILLSIHSPGGLIDPMFATYSFIRALPARIDTHATSFVMSAATTLLLAGENRSADRTARFLFHPSQVPVAGSLNGPQLQDRLIQYNTVDSVTRQIYRDRTALTDAQIDRFNHEEVFLGPDQAKDAGIIQTVKDLHIPGPDKARIVFVD